jgi:hypothetical protein
MKYTFGVLFDIEADSEIDAIEKIQSFLKSIPEEQFKPYNVDRKVKLFKHTIVADAIKA